MVDDNGLDRTSGGFELETELLLNGGKERGNRRVGGSRRYLSAELAFIRSPLEVEVVSARQAGLVYDGTVEDGTLHHGYKVSH